MVNSIDSVILLGRQKLLLMAIMLVSLSVVVALGALASSFQNLEQWQNLVNARAVEERLRGVYTAINDFPSAASNDLRFLRSLSSVTNLDAHIDEEDSATGLVDLRQFLAGQSAYEELYVLDGGCWRLISEAITLTSPICVKNNFVTEQAAALQTLPEGTVQVSPLLKFQKSNGSTIEALIYTTKTQSGGVIAAVINADYFLEEVRRLTRPDEQVFLLAQDGSYLASLDRSKERLAGSASNFYSDYEISPEYAVYDSQEKTLNRHGELVSLLRLSSSVSYAADAGSDSGDYQQYWVLAAVSENVGGGSWWSSPAFQVAALLIAATHIVIGLLFYLMLFPARRARRADDSTDLEKVAR